MDFQLIFQLVITFVVIFALESVLSIDNAAVLAICVNRLPDQKERGKALRYGIWGAYLFRGLSLLGVGWLLANPEWGMLAKLIGGGYLLRLVWTHFTSKADSTEEGDFGWLERAIKWTGLSLSLFWLVVIEVEVLDFVFSIDNLLAVSAMSDNIYVIVAAVFMAILSMRFVTQTMSKLIEKHPWLETRAYYVIALIGLKLVISAVVAFFHIEAINHVLEAEWFDMAFSIASMALFLPIGISKDEPDEQVTRQIVNVSSTTDVETAIIKPKRKYTRKPKND
jgi:YkoY family integral membrane protein